jgi:phosphoglycerol transferase MdoB-like AlkP superfamily enzyme
MSWLVLLLLSVASFVLALFAPWTWLAALAALGSFVLLFAATFALLAQRVGAAARPEAIALYPAAHTVLPRQADHQATATTDSKDQRQP